MSSEATGVRPKIITGRAFMEHLRDEGFILPDRLSRVTIVADIKEPLRIQYDGYGDDRLLSITSDLHEGETNVR